MRNELLSWAEESKKRCSDLTDPFVNGYNYALTHLINKINSIPVPDVEGYLGRVRNWEDYERDGTVVIWMEKEGVLTALQALKEDCDDRCKLRWEAEIGRVKLDALPELAELRSEVEKLRGQLKRADEWNRALDRRLSNPPKQMTQELKEDCEGEEITQLYHEAHEDRAILKIENEKLKVEVRELKEQIEDRDCRLSNLNGALAIHEKTIKELESKNTKLK